MNTGYKNLIVWQKSLLLVTKIYEITKEFPKDETFGLISQMKRAAVSIPSNIAEGSRRVTKKDKNNFYSIAFGSGSELETQIEIAFHLNFISKNQYDELIALSTEILKMLNKMTSY